MTHLEILPAQKNEIVAAIGPASESPEMLERWSGRPRICRLKWHEPKKKEHGRLLMTMITQSTT
jgi:pyruvate kinase